MVVTEIKELAVVDTKDRVAAAVCLETTVEITVAAVVVTMAVTLLAQTMGKQGGQDRTIY